MIIVCIDIVCTVILLTGIRLIAKGKLEKNKPVFIVLLLTFIPIIIFIILMAYTVVLISSDKLNSSKNISISIFVIELIIFLFYAFFKCNSLPYSTLSEDVSVPRNIVMIEKSRKTLNFAIYFSIILLLYSLPIIIPVIKALSIIDISESSDLGQLLFSGNTLDFFGNIILLVFTALFLVPRVSMFLIIGTYIFTIFIIVFAVSMTLAYVLAINGTIRTLKASNKLRRKIVVYILLMLIPGVNIISCITMSRIVKVELKAAGYKAGIC
jgi:hypothetical protein